MGKKHDRVYAGTDTGGSMRESTKLIHSYVWYGDECFFVSTIERDSSAIVEPPAPRFLETLAWRIDPETSERGELVAQTGGLERHFEVCRQLWRTGQYSEEA